MRGSRRERRARKDAASYARSDDTPSPRDEKIPKGEGVATRAKQGWLDDEHPAARGERTGEANDEFRATLDPVLAIDIQLI
jgi:hypothetical protein